MSDEDETSVDDVEFGEYVEGLARILSLGRQGVQEAPDEASAGRLREMLDSDPLSKLDEHYRLIGRLMSAAAELEGMITVLASFLLNPREAGRAAAALRRATARQTLEIVKQAFLSHWKPGLALVDEVEAIQRERNRFAHNPLLWHRFDNGQLVEEVHLSLENRRDPAQSTPYAVSTEQLKRWCDRAEVAEAVILSVLQYLWGVEHRGEEPDEGVPLAFLALVDAAQDRLLLDPELEDLISEHYKTDLDVKLTERLKEMLANQAEDDERDGVAPSEASDSAEIEDQDDHEARA